MTIIRLFGLELGICDGQISWKNIQKQPVLVLIHNIHLNTPSKLFK